jgi:hypothetical protein
MAADLMIYDLAKLAIKEPETVFDVPPNNDSPLLDATQICEVGINAVLSPEFELAKALGSEVLP